MINWFFEKLAKSQKEEDIMWIRAELKAKAKAVLRTNYWKAFLISLVIAVASGSGGSGGSSGRSGGSGHSNLTRSDLPDFINNNFGLFILLILSIVSAIFLFAMAFRIFLGSPLEVGGRRYFIKSAQYVDNRGCFGFAFYAVNYKGIVLTMLLKGIQNFLWFLLLIIPGIVKFYAYRMVPYILADNPNIGYKRAIELSNNMTDGNKFSMFVLDLSFIGWYILGMLAFFIGTLFVMPYQFATEAELYLVLRKNALDNGLCRPEELLLNDGTAVS